MRCFAWREVAGGSRKPACSEGRSKIERVARESNSSLSRKFSYQNFFEWISFSPRSTPHFFPPVHRRGRVSSRIQSRPYQRRVVFVPPRDACDRVDLRACLPGRWYKSGLWNLLKFAGWYFHIARNLEEISFIRDPCVFWVINGIRGCWMFRGLIFEKSKYYPSLQFYKNHYVITPRSF